VMGVALATVGEISFKDGRVEQDNFHNYEVTRMEKAAARDPRAHHPATSASRWVASGNLACADPPRCATRSSRQRERESVGYRYAVSWAFKREHRATVAHATSARKENAPPRRLVRATRAQPVTSPAAWPPGNCAG